MSATPITLARDLDPWERQPRETSLMYARFIVFRDLGTGRTLKQALEILSVTGDRVKRGQLYNISSQYCWAERAEAFDRDQDRLERDRLIRLRREMTERHRKIATNLMATGLEALRKIKEHPDTITPNEVVRLLALGVKVERAALGEPEQTIAVTGRDGGPVEVADFTGLTPDERAARLRKIGEELTRRAAARLPEGEEDDDT